MKITDWMLFWTALASITVTVGLVGGVLVWITKRVVTEQIGEAVKSINGTYTRSSLCKTLHTQVDARFATVDDRLGLIEDKAL